VSDEEKPKFNAFYDWAIQHAPKSKKRKQSIAPPINQIQAPHPQPLLYRCWGRFKPWCPHIVVGALGTVIGGIALAVILPGLGLNQQDITSKKTDPVPTSPPVTEGWDYELNREAR
jgi:hypothetical protein